MKIRKEDIVWNYVGTFLSMGSNLLLLPILMYFMHSETLGLWYVFLSIGGIVILLDFGFSPSFARNIAYSWSGATKLNRRGIERSDQNEPNIFLMNKVIATSKYIYFFISIIALVILLSIGTLYIIHVSSEISGNEYFIAWIIYCFAITLNIYYGYYIVFLRGVGAIKELNIATIISRLAQIFLSILLLFLGFDIIAVVVAYLSYGLLFRLLAKRFFYTFSNIGTRLRMETKEVHKDHIKSTFQLMWYNAWRDGAVALSRYLTGQATVLIVSIYFSLTTTGIYSISMQLVTALSTFGSALYVSYQPSMQYYYVKRDIQKLKSLLSISMTVYTLIYVGGILGVVFVVIPLLNLINTNIIFNIPILISIGIYHFLLRNHSLYASYLSNTNKVDYMETFVLCSILGVLFSFILLNLTSLGVYALIIGLSTSQIVYNNWKWPSVALKSVDLKIHQMYFLGIKKLLQIIPNKFKR